MSTISVDDVVVDEKSGSTIFTLRLDVPDTLPVTVYYGTSHNTAVGVEDYNDVSGMLTFAPGEMVKTVRVPILNDIKLEAQENFTLNLSAASANAKIADSSGLGIIVDNESPAPAAPIVITGTNGNDVLVGTQFADVITGANGNDVLDGAASNDTLIGGLGADTLNGGLGNDLFDFNSISESPVGLGRDSITGFAGGGAAIGDRIDLTTIDANNLFAGNQAFAYIGAAAFTAAGQLRYSGGVLQGSIDADVAAEFEIQLVGTPALVVGGTGTDILL